MNYLACKKTVGIITVLLVDDSTLMLQQVKTLISTEPGIEVIGEATDGLEVITKARDLKPHLVLMDVRLPGQNGLEATRQLKTEMPELNVIVLTLYDLPIYRDTALANGASDYVVKKAMHKELLPAIHRVMQAHHAAGDAGLNLPTPRSHLTMDNIANPQPVQTRVLIVEDNLFNQKIAQKFLEQLGCRVDLAANGREALELLDLRFYDLVFMDCEMPEMDGFEATGEIRRRHARRRIPIIALTAGAQPDDQTRCLAAGMDDYLSKPVRIEALAGTLARWVPVTSPELLQEIQKGPPQGAPVIGAEGNRAALDPATVQRLKNLVRTAEASWFIRLLEKFQSDAGADITSMRQAVAEDDRISLSLAAHRLKGASLNIGARHLGDICRRLETLDRNQTIDAALLAQLEHEFSRVQTEIEQELNH